MHAALIRSPSPEFITLLLYVGIEWDTKIIDPPYTIVVGRLMAPGGLRVVTPKNCDYMLHGRGAGKIVDGMQTIISWL